MQVTTIDVTKLYDSAVMAACERTPSLRGYHSMCGQRQQIIGEKLARRDQLWQRYKAETEGSPGFATAWERIKLLDLELETDSKRADEFGEALETQLCMTGIRKPMNVPDIPAERPDIQSAKTVSVPPEKQRSAGGAFNDNFENRTLPPGRRYGSN